MLFPFKAKRPNFCPPAVAFLSVASPFFGRALPLLPSATRALIFAAEMPLSAHSPARCRALLADNLRTRFPQALAARSRYGVRALRAAYGPHPGRVPCLIQGRCETGRTECYTMAATNSTVKRVCGKTQNDQDKRRNIHISRTKVYVSCANTQQLWSHMAEAEDRGCQMRT